MAFIQGELIKTKKVSEDDWKKKLKTFKMRASGYIAGRKKYRLSKDEKQVCIEHDIAWREALEQDSFKEEECEKFFKDDLHLAI